MKDFLYRLQMKIDRFMYGRNGQDELSNTCYIAGLIILIISLLTRQYFLYYPAFIFWGYSIFRVLSKNTIKRQGENIWFIRKTDKIRKWWRFQKKRWNDRNVSKYYKCKSCKQIIRVPKGRGKIEITCPRCGNTFIKRS